MIKYLADYIVYILLKMPKGEIISEALNFFIYENIKIFLLLFIVIFCISFIRTFFPPAKIRGILSHEKKYLGNIIAASLGVFTPFCTCSAIPLFLGFIEAGVPLGVTFSFLVASPMINEVALVLLWGMFGFRISLIYIISGLTIAVISGIILGILNPEHLLVDYTKKDGMYFVPELLKPSFLERIKCAGVTTLDIVKKIWVYVILGIGIGSWIHGYVPVDLITSIGGKNNILAVPLAVIIGIPLYSNAAGVIPIVKALVEKGVGMGTALSFMMAVVGLSLPEFMILRKVMKLKLIFIFASVVGIGIIITGYLFNFLIN